MKFCMQLQVIFLISTIRSVEKIAQILSLPKCSCKSFRCVIMCDTLKSSDVVTCLCRNPPGFGFLVFKYGDDAEQAVRRLHGRYSISMLITHFFLKIQFWYLRCCVVLLRYAKYCFRSINDTINQNYRDKRYDTIIL